MKLNETEKYNFIPCVRIELKDKTRKKHISKKEYEEKKTLKQMCDVHKKQTTTMIATKKNCVAKIPNERSCSRI